MATLTKQIRVCVDVDDLDRGIAFYCDVLGFRVGRRLGPDWAELLAGNTSIDLLGTPAGTRAAPTLPTVKRSFERHWTPVHLDFVVDDLDEAVAQALAAGATLDREVQARPYGRMANMADPFGHGFCLLQMNERGYDALLEQPENVSA
ncbi:MAG TPA: VOC family protein [Polyangiaceae bacterium]|jgi:catechol 2,3-dioxygenase-like lactoylglutathione lyase family enzyme|nr:VOC family protein [Polyangiaceae bacterium]